MGSAASRHKKTVNKMLAVNALTNGINENSKTEDRQTVENEDMKKSLSKSSSSTVSETEDYLAMSKRGEPRPSLTGEGRSVQESRIEVNDELWVVREDDPQTMCILCKEHTGYEVYPCRICGYVYHLSCLKSTGNLQTSAEEQRMLDLISSYSGWSCNTCENLSRYLSEDEMSNIMELFDQYDINQDSKVSKSEFISVTSAIYEKKFGVALTVDDIEIEELKFSIIDRDRTGFVDWWEFLTYESLNILSKRPKDTLVRLLTTNEIENIRRAFSKFDKDGGGTITYDEAELVYLEWYKKYMIVEDDTKRSGTGEVDMKVEDIMSYDSDQNGSVDWEEFLSHQAIYALGARPNSTKNISWKSEDVESLWKRLKLFPTRASLINKFCVRAKEQMAAFIIKN